MTTTSVFTDWHKLDSHGLRLRRGNRGDMEANVHHVVLHSPTGMSAGGTGSGPADLALSVMHALLPPPSAADERAQFDLPPEQLDEAIMDPQRWSTAVGPNRERVSKLALTLYPYFKDEVVAGLNPNADYVPIGAIRLWIAERRRRLRI
jgi:hypothetical protein